MICFIALCKTDIEAVTDKAWKSLELRPTVDGIASSISCNLLPEFHGNSRLDPSPNNIFPEVESMCMNLMN